MSLPKTPKKLINSSFIGSAETPRQSARIQKIEINPIIAPAAEHILTKVIPLIATESPKQLNTINESNNNGDQELNVLDPITLSHETILETHHTPTVKSTPLGLIQTPSYMRATISSTKKVDSPTKSARKRERAASPVRGDKITASTRKKSKLNEFFLAEPEFNSTGDELKDQTNDIAQDIDMDVIEETTNLLQTQFESIAEAITPSKEQLPVENDMLINSIAPPIVSIEDPTVLSLNLTDVAILSSEKIVVSSVQELIEMANAGIITTKNSAIPAIENETPTFRKVHLTPSSKKGVTFGPPVFFIYSLVLTHE